MQNIKLYDIIATNQYKKIENNIIYHKSLKLNVKEVFQLYETRKTEILNDQTSIHKNQIFDSTVHIMQCVENK